jgi:release factor glutamine methyltransferase
MHSKNDQRMDWQQFILTHQTKIESEFGKEESIAILKNTAAYITRKQYAEIRSEKIDPMDLRKAEEMISQLNEGKPLQYVTGEAWFYKYLFKVNPSVLIPRPETEELIEWMLHGLKQEERPNQSYKILDIGSGSGCIPVCLKKERPQDTICSIDISEEALELAKKNAKNLQADIQFIQMNFLEEREWTSLECYDYIISNPPYIPLREKDHLDKQVRDFEPQLALFVPDNRPLLFYEKIASFGLTHLTPEGRIYVEMHQQFAQQTKSVFANKGYKKVEIKKDISGNERMLMASLP